MKRLLFAVLVLSLLPAAAYAQEATLNGTVTDSTGSVLPGVTMALALAIPISHLANLAMPMPGVRGFAPTEIATLAIATAAGWLFAPGGE